MTVQLSGCHHRLGEGMSAFSPPSVTVVPMSKALTHHSATAEVTVVLTVCTAVL